MTARQPINREDAKSLICHRHGERFVRFGYGQAPGRNESFGCPVCVGLMRSQLRKLRESFKARKVREPYGPHKVKNVLETA